MGRWLQLMKTGTFTDRFKKSYTITKDKLDCIVRNYSGADPAPLVVGHPDKPIKDVPSFGVVDALKVAGDVLFFRPGKAVAEFSVLVSKKAFPSVSACVAGLDGENPMLKHVAFLSAQSPAIEGLEPIAQFSAPDGGTDIDITGDINTAEFSSASEDWFVWKIKSIGRILRSLKNKQIETDGAEKADALINEYDLNTLLEDPPEQNANTLSHFSTSQGGPMNFEKLYTDLKALFDALVAKTGKATVAEFSEHVDAVSTENAALKTENAALKTSVGDFEKKVRDAEFGVFAETLITEGRLLPDQKKNTLAMLETMHQATPAQFSAENGAKSPVEQYKEELKTRPVVAPKNKPEHTAEFSAGDNLNGVEIGNRMSVYMNEMAAKGTPVNVIEARTHILGK